MKKILLSIMLLPFAAQAQTTLFSDNFENGSSNWTINAATLNDEWIVDNIYQGAVMDFGGLFQIPLTPNTPSQPSTFTGGPQSNYLHIFSPFMCSGFQGCNTYSDGSAVNTYATLTQSFSTLNKQNTTFSFNAMVGGKVDSANVTIEYSYDNTTWNQLGNPIFNDTTWGQYNLTNAALDNQASVYFRIGWNNLGSSDFRHAAGIDEIKITVEDIVNNTISAVSYSTTSICEASTNSFNVTFTSTDTFGASNQYIAEISDQNGSFSTPTAIGTLTSAANGALTIAASIPGQLTAGTGYLIRVRSTNPQVTTAGTQAFTIHPKPTVTVNATASSIEIGQSTTLTANGAITYSWSPATTLNSATGASVTATPTATTTYSVIGTNAYGCVNTATTTITVTNSVSVEEITANQFLVYPNPANSIIHIQAINEAQIDAISLVTLEGKMVLSSNQTTLSVSELPTGIYLLTIQSGSKNYTKRVTIQ